MASITSTTGASGLPIESIVSGLMSVERQPLQQLKTQIASYQSQFSAFGTFKSNLSKLQDAVKALSTSNAFNAQTVTVADQNSMTATSDGSASTGRYSVSVSQLATAQKLLTSAYASATSVVGTGTLNISFGTFTAANSSTNTPASFATNADKSAVSITIDSTNNTLTGIRDAINAKNAGVKATIINDGSGFRLSISSSDSGAKNGLNISVTDADGTNSDSSGLSALAYDPTSSSGSGKNLTETVAAKDAILTVDGVTMTSASNSVSGVIQGVTLNLKSTTSASTSLDVGSDSSKIKSSVQGFVDAYNALNNTVKNLTKFVKAGSSDNGPLLGDSTTRDIMTKLKSMLTKSSATTSTYKTLTDIGITFQQDGTLSVDSSKLDKAISNNLSDVTKLFSPSAKTSDPQLTFVSSTSQTKSGTYAVNISALSTSTTDTVGTINGQTAIGSGSNLIGATGDQSQGLRLAINGTATGSRGTVTFSKGLAGELSDAIDAWLDSSKGTITTRTDGIKTTMDRLNDKSDAMQQRLVDVEKRYRSQYAALDVQLSKLQNTNSYISQMVAALNRG